MLRDNDIPDEARNELAFLYLAIEEMKEASEYIKAILKHEWVLEGGKHASPEVRALDIALLITYSRPFSKNYGFKNSRL